jgi:hypothetical protein
MSDPIDPELNQKLNELKEEIDVAERRNHDQHFHVFPPKDETRANETNPPA